MRIVLQIASAFLVMHLALAAKGPVAEPVCDAICPPDFPIVENYHLPYTADCTKFCHCANDGNWKKDCPGGLHFNPNLQVCDWPESAGCVEGSNPPASSEAPATEEPATEEPVSEESSSEEPATQGPTTTEAPATEAPANGCEDVSCGVDGCFKVQNSVNCQQYCDCDHGTISIHSCSKGLFFNPDSGNCDWEANVECPSGGDGGSTEDPDIPENSSESSTGESTENPATEDPVSEEPSSEVPPSSGESSSEVPISTEDPNNSGEPNTSEDPNPPADGDCDDVCPPIIENNLLPYPGDCSKFCQCANNGNWTMDCPGGLHFNPELKICDWPNQAGCTAENSSENPPASGESTENPATENPVSEEPSSEVPPSSGESSSEVPISTEDPNNSGEPNTSEDPNLPAEGNCDDVCPDVWPIIENNHLPFPGDCTKFCHCANDGNWEKDCPAGLHFNPALQVCDWPNEAGCTAESPSSGENNENPGSEDPVSEEPSSEVPPSSGETSSQVPPNSGESSSEVPPNSGESSSEVPTSSENPNNSGEPNTSENPNGSNENPPAEGSCDDVCPDVWPIIDNNHLPFPGDCSKFCHCANDGNWEKDCPPGLHFNPALQVCDWPSDAGCTAESGNSNENPPSSGENNENPGSDDPVSEEPSSEVPPSSGESSSVVPPNSGESSSEVPPNTGESSSEVPPSSGESSSQVPISSENPNNSGEPNTSENPNGSNENPPAEGTCDDVCPDVWPIIDNNHLPFPGDCTKFCHCANDGNWEKDCPPGLHFNPTLQVCDWPSDAGCTAESGNPPSSGENSATDKPVPEEPSSEVPPSSGESSSEVPTSSDAPNNSGEPNTSENPNGNGSNENPSANGTCDDICPDVWPIIENNHLGIPGDCTKFCHCANDGNWVKDCPPGLHFNQALQVCDWPQDANCQA